MRMKSYRLYLRNFALVTGAVVITQFMTFGFLIVNSYGPYLEQAVEVTNNRAEQVVADLSAEAQLPLTLLGSNDSSLNNQPPVDATEQHSLINVLFVGWMKGYLQNELGREYQVAFAYHDAPVLYFQDARLEPYWIRLPLPLFRHYERFVLLGWLFVFPILSLILAALITWQLNRPLNHLAKVAGQLGRGEYSAHLSEESGSFALDTVNKAFNKMLNDLRRGQQDRALLLAGVSHDLRTPLTRLRLTAEFMSDEELQGDIIQEIEDMDAILDQFISFIRDGSDEGAEFGQLNDVVDEVANQFRSLHIDLYLGELQQTSFKRLAMKRVLGNLVSNADRYGGDKITIKTYQDSGIILIEVADNGMGVNEQDIAQLMQPFSMGEKARTGQGSGLGLAIVKRIVELHHGDVELKNHEQGGLQVTIRLPITGGFVQPEAMSRGAR